MNHLKKSLIFLSAIILLMTACGAAAPAEKEEAMESSEEMTFTLEELAKYNGQDGNPAYVAVDGVVYDVSDVPAWSGGEHNGNMAGTDASEAIQKAPHGTSKLSNLPVVGTLVE